MNIKAWVIQSNIAICVGMDVCARMNIKAWVIQSNIAIYVGMDVCANVTL